MESYNETVIETEGNRDYWTISTGQTVWKNRLEKLAQDYPAEVEWCATNCDGSVLYHVPKSWVSIRPPRKSSMTEEQKAIAAERLRKYREEQANA